MAPMARPHGQRSLPVDNARGTKADTTPKVNHMAEAKRLMVVYRR
jgi:hypothetical protein